MKLVELKDLEKIKGGFGGIGGTISSPDYPPRGVERSALDVSSNPEPAKKEES